MSLLEMGIIVYDQDGASGSGSADGNPPPSEPLQDEMADVPYVSQEALTPNQAAAEADDVTDNVKNTIIFPIHLGVLVLGLGNLRKTAKLY